MRLEVTPAGTWADVVARRLVARVAAEPSLRLCLPTGATPRPVYRRVVAAAGQGEVSFGAATVLLVDEFGGLEPDDPARGDVALRRDLVDQITPRPKHYLHPNVDGPDPAEDARRYGQQVATSGLDLTVLGLGRNGHLALNEPGSPRSSTTRVVELAPTTAAGAVGYGARRRPTWGITVGLAELFGSREVWLLATGAHKAEIATRALTGPIGSDCPASFLQEHTNCRVMLDDAAAGPDLG